MIDSLLSQVRNEQKYLITRDEAFYNLFRTHKSEFKAYLNQLTLSLKTPKALELIDEIDNMYSRYEFLLDQEITAMKSNMSSSETQQAEEKNELVDRLNEGIEKLIFLGQTNINQKIENSRQTGSKAALIVQGLAFVSLILELILAFFITRSINRPIKILEASTKQIGEGKFDSIIAVHSPPELAVLANSVSQMSDRLK